MGFGKTSFVAWAAGAIAIVANGCAAESQSAPTTDRPEEVTVTEVHLRPDGHHDVTVRRFPKPQRTFEGGAEIAAIQQAISTTGCVSTNSIRLFDEEGYWGNQICFYGAGTANLNNYARFCPYPDDPTDCVSWASAVLSYQNYSGQTGRFSISATQPCTAFAIGAMVSPASSCEQWSSWVTLD